MGTVKGAKRLLKTLRAAGFEAWLVGGSVRDLQLGLTPKDFDITTSATPEQVKPLFRRVIPTGEKHGTVTVIAGGKPYEVTTYRRDVECDGRHAVVETSTSLEEDLGRRDFTVNAMALDPFTEQIVDPFGGRADLQARLLRCVGDPARRFDEDHLRLMRAVRFAAQLDFELEPATWRALVEKAPLLERVSRERIADELWALLGARAAGRGLALLDSSGLLPLILPELAAMKGVEQPGKWHHLDVFAHSRLAFERAVELTDDPVTRLALLLHDVGKPPTASSSDGDIHFYGHEHEGAKMIPGVVERLKLSSSRRVALDAKQLTLRLQTLVRLHMRPQQAAGAGLVALRRLARQAGPYLDELLVVARADRMAHRDPDTSQLDRLQQKIRELGDALKMHELQSPLSGEEIMRLLDLPPGPAVGRAKQALVDALVDGELAADPDQARAWLREHWPRRASAKPEP